MSSIDLHTHTAFSDGSDQPEELIKRAKALGLSAIAITDHDTCAGLSRAVAEGKTSGVAVIRGCEFSTMTERGELHILGYWLPYQHAPLEGMLAKLRSQRALRNERMVEKLCSLGLQLDMEEVLRFAGQGTVGRPHMAQAMLARGYVQSLREAFERYLSCGRPAYVPKAVLTPDDVVTCLAECGATVSLAHPCVYGYPESWLWATIGRLARLGLDALEAWHSEHKPSHVHLCQAWAQALGLAVSGGSDYHGSNKPDVQLGVGRGNLNLSWEMLEQLMNRRRARGLPCDL
ncbi:MAG: PHP domain-containing protein [Desulfovibrio sp.]|nr:PHP domain-containing protein [Desulfovibrio sp.]